MQCPFCAHEETKVLESRLIDNSTRRRRECFQCSNRFTTYEKPFFKLTVTKKDGREQPFNSEKIKRSVYSACSKIEEDALHLLTKKIEQKILAKRMSPIKTTAIGKIVLQELKKFDKIAYLRYATVHKAIDDPKLLKKELQTIV